MKAVLLDTHAWAWSLMRPNRLSAKAAAAITGAETVLVSPISFFEIAQKVRLGKWPDMAPFASDLPQVLERQGGGVTALDPQISVEAGLLDWPHRDPFDRLLAATARRLGLPIVSANAVFDAVATRVW